MVARRWVIGILAYLALCLIGLDLIWSRSFASQFKPVRVGDDPDLVAFYQGIEQDYETKDVAVMEAMGNTLRADESHLPGGHTKLFEFYSVLTAINCWCRDGYRHAQSFADRRQRLEAWLDRYPKSVTATLALAQLWEYHAWEAVGGYGYRVPPNAAQRAKFAAAWRTSKSYLDRLKLGDDPYYSFVEMRLMQDDPDDTPRRSFDDAFTASVERWPSHYNVYYLYGNGLVWDYNDQAARARLMQQLAAAPDDTDKQVGLALIIGASFGRPPEDAGITWEQVKHAYAVRLQRYGWRNRDWNVMAYLAIQAGDWETAKADFRHIAGRWSDDVWSSQNDFVWHELWASLH